MLNIDIMKYLSLFSETFLWTAGGSGLLYNTCNHRSYEFVLTPCIEAACTELSDLDNLYRIPCEAWIEDAGFKAFVAEVESRGLGCVHEEEGRVYLPPFLSLQQDRLRRQGRVGSTDVLRNFLSLTVYMGGRGWDGGWHKQAEYPSNFEAFMPQERLKAFFLHVRHPRLREVKCLFSCLEEYPDWQGFLGWLHGAFPEAVVGLRAEELQNEEIVGRLQESGFGVEAYYDLSQGFEAGDVAHPLPTEGMSVRRICFVRNEADLEGIESLDLTEKDEIIPLYDGANLDFFRENVFPSKEEILRSRLSKRQVFIHQVMNAGYFGHLTLLPDGNVYADCSAAPLGSMDDSITKTIVHEIEGTQAWRYIRDSEKCRECLYRYLCPSPRFYERMMGLGCILS